MNDFVVYVVSPIASAAGLIGALAWGADSLQSRSCAIYTEETGIETKYRSFDECYLKTPTGWMPWSEYKVRAMTQEQSK